MGMSAWGLLALPLIVQSPQAGTQTIEGSAAQQLVTDAEDGASDLFGELVAMDETAMQSASGGSQTAIDIGMLGVNNSESTGVVDDTTVNNSETGAISSNVVSDNRGITFQNNVTGIGANVINTVNVNIFMEGQ